jgi:two-component system NtrC family response regulator
MKSEKYNILVVDDEEPIRRLLQNELANSRREVHVAENGRQGIQLVRDYWFDVVLLDLRLPDVTNLGNVPRTTPEGNS